MPLAERRHLTVIDTRLGGNADSNMTVARRQLAPEPRRQIEGEAQLSSTKNREHMLSNEGCLH
jgi:hypothetical protein